MGPIMEEKKLLWRSKRSEKGPYGKIWGELEVRDGILLRGKRIVVPRSLQARAIALAHEGHMQTDGTLRLLRETQWFRGMGAEVQKFVDSCKCAVENPHNPTPPRKLKPRPR